MTDLRALLGDKYVLPDLLAAAWDEGYGTAVNDHLLQYDGSDDSDPTPNPYRTNTEETTA